MKKSLIAIIAAVVLGSSVYVVAHELKGSHANTTNAISPLMPPGYGNLSLGMTQSQVTAVMGTPATKTQNPHFEQKTPQQWAAIESQLQAADPSDSGNTSDDPSAAPSRASLKLGALLEHKIKETWRYQPKDGYFAEVAFDATGHVCNLDHGFVMSSAAKS